MLRSMKGLYGYSIKARDGDIGKVVDFYFDEIEWTVRYLIAETGSWLFGKRVLISARLFKEEPVWKAREFPVALTREQVKNSPDIDTDKPVSREMEISLHRHYGVPVYWQGVMPAAVPTLSSMMSYRRDIKEDGNQPESHLRSDREVTGYRLHATDGELGHIDDLVVEDTDWHIRYMAIDLKTWLPGRKVLIAPYWIKEFKWAESSVTVDLTLDEVKRSPPYDPSEPVNRKYEEHLYDYYGKPKYWKP